MMKEGRNSCNAVSKNCKLALSFHENIEKHQVLPWAKVGHKYLVKVGSKEKMKGTEKSSQGENRGAAVKDLTDKTTGVFSENEKPRE